MNLHQRAEATRKVKARFAKRAFDWRAGHTCLHLARAQMLALGMKPPPIPAFRSALGAKRALENRGAANLTELFEGLMLPRITPALMIVGDLGVMPGDPDDNEGFDAVVVHLGGGMAFGWFGGRELPESIRIRTIVAAFRLG